MSYELDQLRAELAYMEKCGGMEQSIRIVRERIAKIESEMSDPWWEAKSQVDAIMLQRNETTWQRKVAEYVLHLEDELAALKAKPQEVPPLDPWRVITTAKVFATKKYHSGEGHTGLLWQTVRDSLITALLADNKTGQHPYMLK